MRSVSKCASPRSLSLHPGRRVLRPATLVRRNSPERSDARPHEVVKQPDITTHEISVKSKILISRGSIEDENGGLGSSVLAQAHDNWRGCLFAAWRTALSSPL